MAEKTLALAD